MDLSQYAQILEIFVGISVIIKMVYDIKLDLVKIKMAVEQYHKTTEYKFEQLEEKLSKLEEQII